MEDRSIGKPAPTIEVESCSHLEEQLIQMSQPTNQGVNALNEGVRLMEAYNQLNCESLGFPKLEDIGKPEK